jgi:hypothetical protein
MMEIIRAATPTSSSVQLVAFVRSILCFVFVLFEVFSGVCIFHFSFFVSCFCVMHLFT